MRAAGRLPAPCVGRVRVNSYGRRAGAGQKFQPAQSSNSHSPEAAYQATDRSATWWDTMPNCSVIQTRQSDIRET